jgi:hypothetical protein
MIKLEIPRIPMSLNHLLRMHWRHQRRDAQLWQREIWFALVQTHSRPEAPYPRAKVSICRQSHGELDPDSLTGCVKHIIDALRYAQVLVDDTPAHLVLTVTQWRCPRKVAPQTLIEIQPLPPNVTQDVLIPTPLYEVRG